MNFSNDQHAHQKLKLCVSGAADAGHCGVGARDIAKELGKEIARQSAVLVTGATTGFPLWASMGAKEENGVSIGMSPASSEREHVEAYRLPLDYMDLIVYTGFGYAGRDLLLTRSSDAVFIGCGRIGTIHEFTIAFEDNKPIGVLEGDWVMDETIRTITKRSNRNHTKIVYSKDPKELVSKVVELVKKDKMEDQTTYSYRPPSNHRP